MKTDELREVIYLCKGDASRKLSKDVTIVIGTLEPKNFHNIPYVPQAVLDDTRIALGGYASTLLELIRLWNIFMSDNDANHQERYDAQDRITRLFVELNNLVAELEKVKL